MRLDQFHLEKEATTPDSSTGRILAINDCASEPFKVTQKEK